MPTRSPEDLFAAWRESREPELLGQVFDATAPRLLSLALHLCTDPADAEDAVQAVFLTAIEKAESWSSDRPLEPWLGGILTNRVKQLYERNARRPRVERLKRTNAVDPEVEAQAREAVALLRTKCESLPAETRTLLLLRLEHGLEPAEIAEVLGRPAGTVRVQLQRALERLRRTWPTSLSLAAVGMTLPSRGLAAIRIAVLSQAETVAAGSAALSLSTGVLLVKKICVLAAALTLAAGMAWWWSANHNSERSAEASPSIAGNGAADSIAAVGSAFDVPSVERRETEAVSEDARDSTTASLNVELVWESDGTPAIDISLALQPAAEPHWGTTRRLHRQIHRSDARGRVRVESLAPGNYEIEIDRGGQSHALEIVANESTKERIVIPRGIAVRGSVVDATGEPLAGATLLLSAPPDYNYGRPVAETDAHGKFAIRDVIPGATLVAVAEGWAPCARQHLFGKAGDSAELVLKLERPGTTIHGIVRDPEGQPVPGATVLHGRVDRFLESPYAFWSENDAEQTKNLFEHKGIVLTTQTEEDGRFRIVGGYRNRWVSLWVCAPGFAPREERRVWEAEAAAHEVEIQLERGCLLEGRARDALNQPKNDVSVRIQVDALHDPRAAYGGPEWGVLSTNVDEEGRFRIQGIPVGPFTAHVLSGRDGQHESADFVGAEAQTIWWEPRIGPGRNLEGRVVDERGIGWAGLTVIAQAPRRFPTPADVSTDEHGNFRFEGCEERPYDVRISHPLDRTNRTLVSRAATRPSDGPTSFVVPRDREPSAWLVGRVLDSDGKTTARNVELRNVQNHPADWHTKADGSFRIGPLVPDRYTLFPRRIFWAGFFGPFELEAGETLDVGDLQLKSPAMLTVSFFDEGGAPVRGGFTVVNRLDSAFSFYLGGPDARGEIRRDDLPPGRYGIAWSHEGVTVAAHALVELKAGLESTVELRRSDLPLIEFRYEIPPTGDAVELEEALYNEAGQLLWRIRGGLDRDDIGERTSKCRLAPGKYRFEMRTDGVKRAEREFEVRAGASGPILIEVEVH